MKPIKYLLGTGFYSGRAPIAPGTAGSLAVLVPAWFIVTETGLAPLLLFFVLTILAGYYSAPWFEAQYGKDPSQFVMDEWSGQLIPLFLLYVPVSWFGLPQPQQLLTEILHRWPEYGLYAFFAVSFLLFRLFDILKPLGIDQLQSLPGATGIIIDDIMAGFYTFMTLFFVILALL